ncbi:hypothetical protein QZH41_007645 [Actinostola sp. cb2023]|nr:hypothetical protein QZH41_007645 [Actinostola sp. cb2023]
MRMSSFKDFKVPGLPSISVAVEDDNRKFNDVLGKNFPKFQWNEIRQGVPIGQGSFGSVFLSEYKGNTVVVKKLLGETENEKKLFLKEARLLRNLDSIYIVNLRAACLSPCAIMLEYMCFDFELFGTREKVSSLDKLFKFLDKHNFIEKFPLASKIAEDLSRGVSYLHKRGIVHRDIKPANVLVSNQHYCSENRERLDGLWRREPIRCKLADFGESRSLVLQTDADVIKTATGNIVRGTPVYRAPEIFSGEQLDKRFTISDLKSIDIWAMGMVFFVIINPDLSCPFQLELENAPLGNAMKFLKGLMKKKKLPHHSEKYISYQLTEWIKILNAHERCTQLNPKDRPTAEEIVQSFEAETMPRCRNIPLAISQSSAVEQGSMMMASRENNIHNDGTNSCAFLSVHFCHRLITEIGNKPAETETWNNIATLAEGVILNTPEKVNPFRDINLKYDAMEAYVMLRSIKEIDCDYFLTEEIITSDGHYIIMDTHKMGEELGGHGNGLLKVFPFGDDPRDVCEWIWKRLKLIGVKADTLFSLSLLNREHKRHEVTRPIEKRRKKSVLVDSGQDYDDDDDDRHEVTRPIEKRRKKSVLVDSGQDYDDDDDDRHEVTRPIEKRRKKSVLVDSGQDYVDDDDDRHEVTRPIEKRRKKSVLVDSGQDYVDDDDDRHEVTRPIEKRRKKSVLVDSGQDYVDDDDDSHKVSSLGKNSSKKRALKRNKKDDDGNNTSSHSSSNNAATFEDDPSKETNSSDATDNTEH